MQNTKLKSDKGVQNTNIQNHALWYKTNSKPGTAQNQKEKVIHSSTIQVQNTKPKPGIVAQNIKP